MLASPRRPRPRKFISAFAPNRIPRQWRLSRPPTRSRINDGIFPCRATSSPAFSLAHANGTFHRAIISPRSWSHGELFEATGEPVTVVNLDGYKGRRLLAELHFPEGKLRLIEKWKTYPDYLRDVARHKIVLQLDRSHVPGQVAGDALLCRIPCVGGDGAIERIAFSKTCGEGRTINEVASMALDLLKNPDLREAVVAESQERAREWLSFEAVRTQLAKFFANVQGTSAFEP